MRKQKSTPDMILLNIVDNISINISAMRFAKEDGLTDKKIIGMAYSQVRLFKY